MKLEEVTEFWFDWGNEQQLTVHEGLAMATDLLAAGPMPLQLGVRSSTYIALGEEVPPPWLALFQPAHDPSSFQVEMNFTARAERGVWVQHQSLAPCERGEHLHASIVLSRILPMESSDTVETARAALFEAWREVGDRMGEMQEQFVLPYLDMALDLDGLHGGQG